ncbi:hypothetical protein Psi02_66240 [Planotetraspora silvatica]|uniref:Glycosyltransferase n=1 Tax=Planotetraspora silvatica TaxID=234614 RepID=A0A8J3UT15_9ACTN|nr:glycosyltransferase family 4 protein [Planotetraspora silvatica]GII50200.1 hypothetical protein Psi02_66240 [Planotetraspora silvatica]
MHIAIFVENRNAIALTGRLIAAERPEAPDFSVLTADVEGDVAAWVAAEGQARLPHTTVRNLFEVGEPVGDREFADELERRIVEFAEKENVDRLVLFNDQSRRGRLVARALNRRLPVVLVQDGHLDFHYKRHAGSQRDQNWYYGASGPSAVCVWGPATSNHLRFRSSSEAGDVVITGALGHSDDLDLVNAARAQSFRPSRTAGEPLRIVVLDQSLSDQGKLTARDHREVLTEMLAALAPYGTIDVKPHPSSRDSHLEWLQTLPDVTVRGADVLVDAAGLRPYDLAVTFFSTTYLQTLRAGTPLVLYNPERLNIVFPVIQHAMLRNVGSIGALTDVALQLKTSATFAGNAHGEPLDHFLSFGDGVADNILDVITGARVPREPSPAPVERATSSPVSAPATLAERALADVRDRVTRPHSLAVLGDDFSYATGVAVPVLTYTQSLLARSPVAVHYFDIQAFSTVGDVLAALRDMEVVLVNSLAFFWRSPIANAVVRALVESGVRVAVYVHETQWVMDYEARIRGDRHTDMLELLPLVQLLCVSKAQADLFRILGARDPMIVYNTVPRDPERRRAREGVSSESRIVMVGSVQDRKGVDLFSRVAERARALGLPWRFTWIGQRTRRLGESTLVSDAVEWLGPLPRRRVRRELAESDVFFLSSVDDPMPLSVIEAVQQRLRVVTYERVGSHEVLAGVSGYRSFGEYTPDAAFAALQAVLCEPISEDGFREVEDLFDIPAFTERMSTALSLPRSADAGRSNGGLYDERLAARAEQRLDFRVAEFKELYDSGRHDDALRVGNTVLLDRSPMDVLLGMADILAQEGELTEARRLLTVAALNAGDRAKAWLTIGRLARGLGPGGKALSTIAAYEALRINPSARTAWALSRSALGARIRRRPDRGRRKP